MCRVSTVHNDSKVARWPCQCDQKSTKGRASKKNFYFLLSVKKRRGGGTVPQNWGPGGRFRFWPYSGIWQTKKSPVRLGKATQCLRIGVQEDIFVSDHIQACDQKSIIFWPLHSCPGEKGDPAIVTWFWPQNRPFLIPHAHGRRMAGVKVALIHVFLLI